MKCLVLSDQRLFYGLVCRSVGAWVTPYYHLDKGERTPYPDLGEVFRGDPADPETYRMFDPADQYVAVLAYAQRSEAERVARALTRALPQTYLLFLSLDEHLPESAKFERMRARTWDEAFGRSLLHEIRTLVTAWDVERLRAVLAEAKKIGILLQNDPDPDAIASGLALRSLVNRNRVSAPLLSFGAVTRPENLAMLRILDLQVQTIAGPKDLEEFSHLACVDIQPPVFGDRLGGRQIDVVIDHHPEAGGYNARFQDVRPGYGATATIMTEYFRAAGIPMNQRHATALLYGLKTDTLLLGRETSHEDIEAFYFLYRHANLNWLRRMENPEIPRDALASFGRALARLELDDGLAFAWIGQVREDVIAQVADLLLQVEGAEWAVCAGIAGDNVVASVRNAGYVRAAGDVVKRVFGEIGSAGGHRTMAKVVVPKEAFKNRWQGLNEKAARRAFYGAFLEELRRLREADRREQPAASGAATGAQS